MLQDTFTIYRTTPNAKEITKVIFIPKPSEASVNKVEITENGLSELQNDTITFCSEYGYNPNLWELGVNYELTNSATFESDTCHTLTNFYVNGVIKDPKLTLISSLKTGDRIQVKKLPGLFDCYCLYNENKDTVVSNEIIVKILKAKTDTINVVLEGKDKLCIGENTSLKTEYSGQFYWTRNKQFISSSHNLNPISISRPGNYQIIGESSHNGCFKTNSEELFIVPEDSCRSEFSGFVYDKSDFKTPYSGVLIKTNSGLITISDSLGHYQFEYYLKDYFTELSISSSQFYNSPLKINTEYGFYKGPQNLYTYKLSETDAAIFLNSSRNRPGFTIPYYVSIHNRGKNPLTTNVSVILDGNLTYTSQSGENKPTTASGQTLTWDNITVESGATKRLIFYATLDRKTPLGTELVSTAQLIMATPDDVPENDKTTFKTIVSGSFDPNDKLVTYAGAFTEGYVYDTTSFEYTIRFQNTGTDTAFTVRVEDVISNNLDLTTIKFIDSSHESAISISGDTVKWLFENILLADSNTNEPASHGFVRFFINQKTGNQAGTEIKNKAAIYFDFNDPVITNEIVSTVNNDIVTELEHEISYQTQGIISAYPNPARTTISINAEGAGSFELFNAIGSQVLKTSEKENINIESLKRGMYYYQFITNEKTFSGSFMKE